MENQERVELFHIANMCPEEATDNGYDATRTLALAALAIIRAIEAKP